MSGKIFLAIYFNVRIISRVPPHEKKSHDVGSNAVPYMQVRGHARATRPVITTGLYAPPTPPQLRPLLVRSTKKPSKHWLVLMNGTNFMHSITNNRRRRGEAQRRSGDLYSVLGTGSINYFFPQGLAWANRHHVILKAAGLLHHQVVTVASAVNAIGQRLCWGLLLGARKCKNREAW